MGVLCMSARDLCASGAIMWNAC